MSVTTKAYKITTQDGLTRAGHDNETRWGEGIEHTAPGGGELCSSAYLHAYASPLLAAFMNPIYAALPDPVLWECNADIEIDDGMKLGCTRLRTLHQIPLPEITTAQRVRAAIYCTQSVIGNRCPDWSRWAERWLDGTDRSEWAARASARAAEWAAEAAREAARAVRARASAWAAYAAALAAAWVEVAAWARAEAAGVAAWAAARAVRARAVRARASALDLTAIIRRAIAEEKTQ